MDLWMSVEVLHLILEILYICSSRNKYIINVQVYKALSIFLFLILLWHKEHYSMVYQGAKNVVKTIVNVHKKSKLKLYLTWMPFKLI